MSNKYRGVSDPHPTMASVVEVLGQLKENVELLTGQRGVATEYSVDARIAELKELIEKLAKRVQALE